jgi:cytochrome c peroxidase
MLGDAKANDLVTTTTRDYPADLDRIGYLHDGRARTIDEAVRWHGGEAQASKVAYEGLNDTQRNAVLDFLESL